LAKTKNFPKPKTHLSVSGMYLQSIFIFIVLGY